MYIQKKKNRTVMGFTTKFELEISYIGCVCKKIANIEKKLNAGQPWSVGAEPEVVVSDKNDKTDSWWINGKLFRIIK